MRGRTRHWRGAAILAALAVAACDDSPTVTHYVLALSWQPGFCRFNVDKPECRDLDSADFAATNLTVHGLWPNDGPSSGPSYCNVDAATKALDESKSWCELPRPKMTAETRTALAPAMPGTASCLERHEWIKHGTCSGLEAEDYFADTLRLAAAVQATGFGEAIAANIGQNVTPRQLSNAFEAVFGAGSSKALTLVCTERNGSHYLAEIRIALETPSVTGTLERDHLYLAGEPPAGSCPDMMRIDSANP
ncbi:MAG: ribonuclease [Rhodospirillum sp.]|nr:ribonuclease [Rhodospirillum sp.]